MNSNQLIQQIKIPLLTNQKELEYFTIHQERYRIILEEIAKLNLPRQSRTLDIGCYPTHLYHALEREPFAFNMNGIASNHEPVENESIKQLNIEKEKLPFKKDRFDLILMTEIIEHLTVNPEIYLSEVRRVLKPDGYLLITTPNAAHLKNRAKALLGRSTSFPLEQLMQTYAEDESIYHRHNREFTLSELQAILKHTKYTVQKATYQSFYTPFRDGKALQIKSAVGFGVTQVYSPLKDSLLIIVTK